MVRCELAVGCWLKQTVVAVLNMSAQLGTQGGPHHLNGMCTAIGSARLTDLATSPFVPL